MDADKIVKLYFLPRFAQVGLGWFFEIGLIWE